jgi:hypothetical protein
MKRKIIIIVALLVVFIGLIYALKTMERLEAQRRDNELDAARDEFKATVENPEFYRDSNNEYVKSVEAKCIYDDGNWSTYVFKQNNEEHVIVYLDDAIDTIDERQKCEMFVSIAKYYISRLQDAYNHSRYLEFYNENRIGYTMDYKGKEVEIDHYCTLENFTFKTENRTYSLDYKNRTDGRYLLTDKNIAEDKAEFYVFLCNDGTVKDFEKESDLKARNQASKNKASSKKNTSSGSGASKSSGTGKSKTSKTYDTYDVHDYKSAQEFADDKYEEFYDYEDDFEDEDEAYDAAEDYWNDNH